MCAFRHGISVQYKSLCLARMDVLTWAQKRLESVDEAARTVLVPEEADSDGTAEPTAGGAEPPRPPRSRPRRPGGPSTGVRRCAADLASIAAARGGFGTDPAGAAAGAAFDALVAQLAAAEAARDAAEREQAAATARERAAAEAAEREQDALRSDAAAAETALAEAQRGAREAAATAAARLDALQRDAAACRAAPPAGGPWPASALFLRRGRKLFSHSALSIGKKMRKRGRRRSRWMRWEARMGRRGRRRRFESMRDDISFFGTLHPLYGSLHASTSYTAEYIISENESRMHELCNMGRTERRVQNTTDGNCSYYSLLRC
jgi:hypothetical protein